ncbi:MAG: hypothetical protein M3Q48_14650 [Actinomycetota bacterium]|nr:hypothetical protein [Actinomycetota bacterium]
MQISTWRTDAGDLDVLTEMAGAGGRRLRYADLVRRAAVLQVVGITVRVASLDDVISSKEWADRPKDRDALPELRTLASARREAGLRGDGRAEGAPEAGGQPPSPRRSSGPAAP